MTQQAVINTVVPILKKYGVEKASLFGSYVRGDYDEKSDIDLLIEPPEGMGLFKYAHLKNILEDELGKKVDLVSFNGINKYLKHHILAHTKKLL